MSVHWRNTMKSVAVLVVIFASIWTAEAGIKPNSIPRMLKYVKTCTTKHGTNAGELVTAVMEPSKISDDKIKCTMDCFMKEANYMNDKGEIQWDTIKERISEAFDDDDSIKKATEIADECKAEVKTEGQGECEVAVTILPCVMQKLKEKNFPVPDLKDLPHS